MREGAEEESAGLDSRRELLEEAGAALSSYKPMPMSSCPPSGCGFIPLGLLREALLVL